MGRLAMIKELMATFLYHAKLLLCLCKLTTKPLHQATHYQGAAPTAFAEKQHDLFLFTFSFDLVLA